MCGLSNAVCLQGGATIPVLKKLKIPMNVEDTTPEIDEIDVVCAYVASSRAHRCAWLMPRIGVPHIDKRGRRGRVSESHQSRSIHHVRSQVRIQPPSHSYAAANVCSRYLKPFFTKMAPTAPPKAEIEMSGLGKNIGDSENGAESDEHTA